MTLLIFILFNIWKSIVKNSPKSNSLWGTRRENSAEEICLRNNQRRRLIRWGIFLVTFNILACISLNVGILIFRFVVNFEKFLNLGELLLEGKFCQNDLFVIMGFFFKATHTSKCTGRMEGQRGIYDPVKNLR